VLRPILVHAVDQIRGGDHVRSDPGAVHPHGPGNDQVTERA
jgi:hypothetical protein